MPTQGFTRNRAIVLGLSITSMGAQAVMASNADAQSVDLGGLVSGDFGASAFVSPIATPANLVERYLPQGCDPSGCNLYGANFGNAIPDSDSRSLQTLFVQARYYAGQELVDARLDLQVNYGGTIAHVPGCTLTSPTTATCPVGRLDPSTDWLGLVSIIPTDAVGYKLSAVLSSPTVVNDLTGPATWDSEFDYDGFQNRARITRIEQDACPFASMDIGYTDMAGEPVSDPWPTSWLTQVFEDGTFVGSHVEASLDTPLSIALVVDDSGAVDTAAWDNVRLASATFIQDWASWSNAQGVPMPSIAIYSATSTALLMPFTTDVAALSTFMQSLSRKPQATKLFSTLSAVSDGMLGRPGRHAAFLLATGADAEGSRARQQAMAKLSAAQVNVYSVVSEPRLEQLSRELAGTTGGLRARADIDGGISASLLRLSRQVRSVRKQAWISPYATANYRDVSFRLVVNQTFRQGGSRGFVPASPACQANCGISRVLPATVTGGATYPVALTVKPSPTQFTTVSEAVPEDLAISGITGGGVMDVDGNMIFWEVPPGNQPVLLRYDISLPTTWYYGTQRFSGFSSTGGGLHSTCGDVRTEVGTGHSASFDEQVGRIHPSSLAAYTRAWKAGAPWIFHGESQIRMAYVTRGAQLARFPANYRIDPSQSPPWVSPGTTPGVANARTRALPSNYVPAVPFTVTLSYTSSLAAGAGAIEEVPPAGWTISNISDGGVYDPLARMIRWGVFSGTSNRSVSYTLTPPASASGPVRFDGRVSVDGNEVDFTEATLQSPTSDLIFRSGFDS